MIDDSPVADNAPPAETDDSARSIDAWRLLRLIRLRRELKVLSLLAVAAVPLWAVSTLAAESLLPRTSDTFWAVDDTIGPGFLIILAVLAAALLALVGTGLLGAAGRTAARVSPTFGRAPELDIVDGGPSARGLYGRLRRRPLVRASAVLMFVLIGVVAGITGWNALPAWRADHGHGGPIVTIGQDATITYSTVSSRGHRDYFLATPYGPAIAEDYAPTDGQRWTVLPSDVGNGKAYLIGGYDYVLLAGVCLACLLACAGIAAAAARAARVERSARAAIGGTLADSVTYLSDGHTLRLRIVGRRPSTVELAMRPVGPRGAAAWLRRRRQIAAVTTIAVVAAAGTLVGLWWAGAFSPPLEQRAVTLVFLAPTSWDPEAVVQYANLDASTNVLHLALSDGGSATSGTEVTASAMVSSPRTNDSAYIDVATIGSTPPAAAVADTMAFQRYTAEHRTVTTLTGLPAGWQGELIVDSATGFNDIELAGAADGLLVSISVYGTFLDPGPHTDGARELARAIAAQAIPRFAAMIAR